MSSIPELPPLSVQDAELTASNNSAILSIFFFGSYSTVYLGTLYLYVTRKAPQRKIVISAITSLYLIALIQFAVQWFLVQYGLMKSSNGNESAYIALFDYPAWSHILIDATSFAMFSVADALLIWRCYNAWGGSYRIILLPSFFLLLEIGFSLSSIILIFAVHLNPDIPQRNIINDLQSTVFFLSFAASLSTTVLIAYRIYASARDIVTSDQSHSTSISKFPSSSSAAGSSSKGRFTHVIQIIIESAAVYSLVLLVAAISGVIPDSADGFPSPSVYSLSSYTSFLLIPAAGMAPTIMVARVSLASRRNTDHVVSRSRDAVLSNLRFGVASANPNEIRTVDWRANQEEYGDAQVHNSRYTGEEKNSTFSA